MCVLSVCVHVIPHASRHTCEMYLDGETIRDYITFHWLNIDTAQCNIDYIDPLILP